VAEYRESVQSSTARKYWWRFARTKVKDFNNIAHLNQVLISTKTTKHFNFVFLSPEIIFDQSVTVIGFDKFCKFSILQTNIHELWATHFGTTLRTDRRYSPQDCFETFPFPQNLSSETESKLEQLGESYHEFRRELMHKMQLGLTKTYNQFHNPKLAIVETGLSAKEVEKQYGKETKNLWNHLNKTDDVCSLEEAITDIKQIRQRHKEMDEAVLEAYGWHEDNEKLGPAIDLAHNFYEVDYLPENDRIRYTISPEARKEVLKRLLLLNHEIYEEEVKQGLHDKKKTKSKTKKNVNQVKKNNQVTMFDSGSSGPVKSTKLKSKSSAASFNKTLTKNSDYQIGQNVEHPLFGKGEIVAIDGIGATAKLTIKFEYGPTKKLVAKYANLDN